MSNSKTFDEILFVVFVARKWKCKISCHGCHGYDYHCSHACHGHHGDQDRQDSQDNQDKRDRQDRQIWHLNLTFQVTCVGQLSQFLWCLIFQWDWKYPSFSSTLKNLTTIVWKVLWEDLILKTPTGDPEVAPPPKLISQLTLLPVHTLFALLITLCLLSMTALNIGHTVCAAYHSVPEPIRWKK